MSISPVKLVLVAAAVAAATALVPGPAASAGPAISSWPMFMNGPLHSSTQPGETRISPSTASLLEPAWIDRDKGSSGYYGSSPVVYNRFLYIGDEAGRLTKRDANSGTASGGWTFHAFNSVYATPAVGLVGTAVMAFAADLSGYVYAVKDQTGVQRWRGLSPHGGILGGPTLVGRTLYTAGVHGEVTAWNAATGDKRWHVNPPHPVGTRTTGAPTVIDQTVYVGDSVGNLWALDGSTTAPTPLLTFKGGKIEGTIASDGKHLYFTVRYDVGATSDVHAVAYDIALGSVIWDVDLGRAPGALSYDVPSPAVVSDVVLVPTDLEVNALSRTTGALLYRSRTVDSIEPTTPSVANGVYFVAGVQAGGASVGALSAYRVATGEPLYFTWIPTVANTTPAIWNGHVYVGSGNVSGGQGEGVLYGFRVSPLA